ncbi:type II secretion system protein [Quadrisphaera sp. KR29]|uniref:type II secretion system protein n=1 Tax=Quadrisphaera sp. KR29 TaxID=3461391 RepID=UPI00404488D0
MMARIRKSMEEKDQGFTLIELLVVMIIIGILAAIAVPVFLSQRAKARLTSAKSDASVISKELAAYYVDGSSALSVSGATAGGTWTVATTAATPVTVTTGKLSPGNVVTAGSGTTTGTYCVLVSTSTSGDGNVTVTSQGLTVNSPSATTCTAA